MRNESGEIIFFFQIFKDLEGIINYSKLVN